MALALTALGCIALWRCFPYSSQALKPHTRLPCPIWALNLYIWLPPNMESFLTLFRHPQLGWPWNGLPFIFCLGSDSTHRAIPCVDTSVTSPSTLGLQNPVWGYSQVCTLSSSYLRSDSLHWTAPVHGYPPLPPPAPTSHVKLPSSTLTLR